MVLPTYNAIQFNAEAAHKAKVNSQKWKCLVTGFITNPGTLSGYQRARGIDTSQRVRVE